MNREKIMTNLNARQEQFVQALFEGKTKKEAAIAAGYSAKSAGCIGSELARMPKIRARVEELQEADRRAKRTQAIVFDRLRGAASDGLQPVTICAASGAPIGLFVPLNMLFDLAINA
jgi:phage terminase small subunit